MAYFDEQEDFGPACLVEDKGEVTLYLNDSKCRSGRVSVSDGKKAALRMRAIHWTRHVTIFQENS
jgi:hypothetical protein